MRPYKPMSLVLACLAAMFWSSAFGAAGLSAAVTDKRHTVTSPDGHLSLVYSVVEGVPYYSVLRDGRVLVKPSPLGLNLAGTYSRLTPAGITVTEKRREQWTPVFDKASPIVNEYHEFDALHRIHDGRIDVTFRIYNDGVALRYTVRPTDELIGSGPLRVIADRTEFRFADDCVTWSYNGEHGPKGPLPLSEVRSTLRMPVTLKAADDCYMAVLQAALVDYDIVDLAPIKGHRGLAASLDECTFNLKDKPKDEQVIRTPWYVIQVADSPGKLLESHILPNLNPPCAIEDTSWIEPGLCLWDWRCWGAKTKDGFTYDLDMPSWKRLIDFASTSGIRYVMLDANWYGPEFDENSDPTVPKSGTDIPGLIRYATERNVKIILYFNHAATKHHDFDHTLATYKGWGAAGLKYGFLKGYEGQAKVNVVREIVRKCAEHKLIVDFHDNPIPPSGDRRTWPNLIVREFCHAQSDAKRSFSPSDFTSTVFVNMLAGPLDMTNGLYDLNKSKAERPRVFEEVWSTAAGETARPLIVFAGLNVLHDHGDAYAEKADLFEFIRRLPMRWDETRILHGQIGQYVTTARRHGDEWYLGSATNEEGRTLDVKLDFLPEGTAYLATLYEDAPDAHFKTNREAYQVRQIEVRRGDTIPVRMAPGGGQAIWLRPKKGG